MSINSHNVFNCSISHMQSFSLVSDVCCYSYTQMSGCYSHNPAPNSAHPWHSSSVQANPCPKVLGVRVIWDVLLDPVPLIQHSPGRAAASHCPCLACPLWYHLISSHFIWFQVMPFDVKWCHLRSSAVIWCQVMSFNVRWCQMMSFDVIWCHLMSSGEIPYHTKTLLRVMAGY